MFLVGQKIYTADWDGSDRPDIVQQHLLSTTALVIHYQYNAMTILADFGEEVQALCKCNTQISRAAAAPL